jgi:hypothetical protein
LQTLAEKFSIKINYIDLLHINVEDKALEKFLQKTLDNKQNTVKNKPAKSYSVKI